MMKRMRARPCGCYYFSSSCVPRPQQSPSVPCDATAVSSLPCVTIPGQGDKIEEAPDTLMNVREEMTKCHGYYWGLGLGVSEAGFSGGSTQVLGGECSEINTWEREG